MTATGRGVCVLEDRAFHSSLSSSVLSLSPLRTRM